MSVYVRVCVCVCMCAYTVRCDSLWPHGCSQPGSSILGTFQARILEWVAITFFTYTHSVQFSSVQFSSTAQSCLTLCDPMNHSTPALPVHQQLQEFTQTHVHRVGDAIQPSHPLSSPSPPAPIPLSIRVFSNESALRMRWPKYWSFSFSHCFHCLPIYFPWSDGTRCHDLSFLNVEL